MNIIYHEFTPTTSLFGYQKYLENYIILKNGILKIFQLNRYNTSVSEFVLIKFSQTLSSIARAARRLQFALHGWHPKTSGIIIFIFLKCPYLIQMDQRIFFIRKSI